MELALELLMYGALGFLALAGGVMVAEQLRSSSCADRIRGLAASLEECRVAKRHLEEELSIARGKLDVYEKQQEMWRKEREQLSRQIEELKKRLEEQKRVALRLAEENKAALNLYEALSKGKIKLVDEDGNECRVLVDGSIICKDRLVYPEVS